MTRLRRHRERHLVARIGWLRAAVLGANDGIVSTASLIVGVAASAATHNDILIAGVAGLVAGSMSMAAGMGRLRTGSRASGWVIAASQQPRISSPLSGFRCRSSPQ